MKKKVIFYFLIMVLFLFLILLPLIRAETVMELKKQTIYDVVPYENVNIPAEYTLTVRNPNSYNDVFRIYTLLEAELLPNSDFQLPAGEERTITVTLRPEDSLKDRCRDKVCKIHYYFKAIKTGIIEDGFEIRILSLDNIMTPHIPAVISRDDSKIIFDIENKRNIDLDEVKFTINFDFILESEETKNITLNLGPESKSKVMEFKLDTSKLKTAVAGDYEAELKYLITGKDGEVYEHTTKKIVKLEEVTSLITSESTNFGFFGFTNTITKKNEGNTPRFIIVEIVKNRFENAFTSSNIEPTSKEPSGILVRWEWQRELQPGETFNLEVHTDYTIPAIILILIIIVILAIWLVRRPRVIIKKKAYRIKTKGGEFAIKIVLVVKNIGREIKNVKCVDWLPHMINKIYERFGMAKPDKIEKNRLMWNFGDMMPGEEKVVSYIVYSKIVPVGTLTLSRASVAYTNNKDRRNTSYSNTLLVMGETGK